MKDNYINRKDFLKTLGGLSIAATGLTQACKTDKKQGKATAAISMDDIDASKMEYRTCPNSGDVVSLLGYGCMRLPRKKDENGNRIIDQETWNDLVDVAIEKGVNYFDTAPAYGNSEHATGIALSRYPRDKYFIATKLSTFDPATRNYESSVAMYHNSFKELQVDYIDYYLLHAVGMSGVDSFKARYVDNGVLDFLLKERKSGRIRNLGWSFHGDVKVFDYLLTMDVKWDFVQIQLNYMDWKHASSNEVNAEYLYTELAKRKIPAIIMEPLLGGRLAKMPTFVANKLKEKEPELSLASWAFRYAGTFSNVLTVLSGMTYKEHLLDDLKTYSPLKPIKKEETELLEEVAQLIFDYPLISCTECRYCMPCPYGIDIPAVFAHYNKCVNEENILKSSEDENYKEARRAFLVGYDRSVPKLRQADHCISCGLCVSKCPQRIKIPREMRKINKYVEDLKQGAEFS